LVGTGAHECFLLQDILMGTEKFDLGVWPTYWKH
jgi:hypothetical protein